MDDLFDGALSLEETLYTQGYEKGIADGELAGKLEGRSVGMGKGFDKFVESGRLYGRSVVWANRTPTISREHGSSSSSSVESRGAEEADGEGNREGLPPLPDNARLAKNIETVHALMEPGTLSTENSDEAVQDFDDRLKRAQGKARIVEKTVLGRAAGKETGSKAGVASKGGEI